MKKNKRYFWLVLIILLTSPLLWVPIAQIIPWGIWAILMMGLGSDLYEKLTSGTETSQVYKAIIALILTGVFTLLTILVPYYLIEFSGFTGY